MRIYVLDGKQMTSRERAHEHLRRALDLPDYYGGNLDALHDCLTDFSGGAVIVLVSPENTRAALGAYGERLIRVFRESSSPDTYGFICLNDSAEARDA